MPGGLCCYCHVPRGITLRCGASDCCESFHFMCHWRNGGFCELRDADIYIGGGRHPCLRALCFKHMPPARRAALPAEALLRASMQGFSRGNPNTLREVLQRLDGPGKPSPAGNSQGNSAAKASSAGNSAANSMGNPAGNSASKSNSAANSTASSAGKVGCVGGRFGFPREICDVCGFGFAAPPINQEMVLEGSRLGRCVNIRREETPGAAHAVHPMNPMNPMNAMNASNASTSSPSFPSPAASASAAASLPSNRHISKPRGGEPSKRGIVDRLTEKLETAGQHVDCGSGVYLQPGTRGNMLHCVVCGTVVHEVCADLPRIQVLAQFDHVKCIPSGRFIPRLRVLHVSPGVHRPRAAGRRVSARRSRESRALSARVLLRVRRPRGVLRSDRGRGFGAQKMRAFAARIGLLHAPLPDDDRNQPDFPVPQRRGAHARAVRAARRRLHGAAVQRDVGSPRGSEE